MKHFLHWLKAAAVVVVAAVPVIAADPSVGHYVAQHPAVAAYLPIAVGVIHALAKSLQNDKPAA